MARQSEALRHQLAVCIGEARGVIHVVLQHARVGRAKDGERHLVGDREDRVLEQLEGDGSLGGIFGGIFWLRHGGMLACMLAASKRNHCNAPLRNRWPGDCMVSREGESIMRTNSKALRGLFAIVMALGLAAGSAAEAQEVKLGAFVTLSGISADVGAQMKAGIEVAVERMQPTFTINGVKTPIKVIWYDDEGKGEPGLNVVTRALTVDKITAGIGFLSSDVFIRVMDEFQKASTPIITCCSASLKIGDKIAEQKMQYVFQLSPTAKDVATAIIAAVATLEKPAKVAMLNENTDAGRDFSRISQEWLKANAPKTEVVADEFVARGVPDLTPQLAKFKRLGAGAIVGEVYGTAAAVVFPPWDELPGPSLLAHMGTT